MRLHVQNIERDPDTGSITAEASVSKHAIIADEQNNTAEVISDDAVAVDAILWSRENGVFQVQLALGGYDSQGKFHRNLQYKTGLVSWTRDGHPELWQKYDLENVTTLSFDAVLSWLQDERQVNQAGNVVWKLPKLESRLMADDGTPITEFSGRYLRKKTRKMVQ